MSLRLIETVLKNKRAQEVCELLKDQKIIEYKQLQLTDKEALVRILLNAEESESVLDILAKKTIKKEDNRIVVLPVEATIPVAIIEPTSKSRKKARIAREELYEDIKEAAQCSRIYMVMVLLSTIVAAVGLYNNSVSILIGAMVIAPILGSSMALALGTTLGDLTLLRDALFTSMVGILMTISLAVLIGAFVYIDTSSTEIVLRTNVKISDIAVALASGCAGALAFTTGVSTTLLGVMVAVALLPPLVTFGLLLGSTQITLAMGALSLFFVNLICVNLAGVTTFLLQGIHPLNYWEKNRARKATRIAMALWIITLMALIALIWFLQ